MSNTMFYIGPVIGVVVTVLSLVFVMRFLRGMANANKEAARILSTGHPATGQVLSAQQTGTYVNNNPQVMLVIHVTPQNGGAPYQTQLSKIVSMFEIPQYQVGAQLALMVDPGNPMKIAIAGPATPVAAPMAGAAMQPGYPQQVQPVAQPGMPPQGYAPPQGYPQHPQR